MPPEPLCVFGVVLDLAAGGGGGGSLGRIGALEAIGRERRDPSETFRLWSGSLRFSNREVS